MDAFQLSVTLVSNLVTGGMGGLVYKWMDKRNTQLEEREKFLMELIATRDKTIADKDILIDKIEKLNDEQRIELVERKILFLDTNSKLQEVIRKLDALTGSVSQ